MARQDEFTTKSANPAKYFLEWKSDDKCLGFYDKEKAANVPLKLPFQFLVLKQLHTVRGFNEKTNSGLYANDVENISEQVLTVRSHKDGIVATGLYKDIKEKIVNEGGVYCKSIYIMSKKGELLNLQLKGAPGYAWGEFIKKDVKRLGTEWVTITDFTSEKKGKVEYSIPVFAFSGAITAEQSKQADAKYDEIIDYIKGGSTVAAHIEAQTESTPEEEDDLPF